MFEIGDKITMRLYGESHVGIVKQIKWGLIFIDFQGKHKNGWFEIRRAEKLHEIQNID